jgi:hypothetical protein
MADSTELPNDHPMRVAFREYQNTDEYENNRKWAQFSQNVDGSLWSVFIAGMSAQSKLNAATPPADAALIGKLRHQLAQVTEECAALRARPQADAHEVERRGIRYWREKARAGRP